MLTHLKSQVYIYEAIDLFMSGLVLVKWDEDSFTRFLGKKRLNVNEDRDKSELN